MRFVAVLLFPLLASCLPSTVAQLKESAPAHQFLVDLSYQMTYRVVEEFLEECIPGGFLMATNSVRGNLYTDLKTADITVQNNNMGDKSTMVRVEIKAIGEQSDVTVYSAPVGIWKDYGRTLERSLRAGTKTCS